MIAAESLANDPGQRAEIAASLMGVPVEEVKVLAAKQAAKTRGRASLVAGRTRAVVVEYKRPRMSRPTSHSEATADARRAAASRGRAVGGISSDFADPASQIGQVGRRRAGRAILAARRHVGRDDGDRD